MLPEEAVEVAGMRAAVQRSASTHNPHVFGDVTLRAA